MDKRRDWVADVGWVSVLVGKSELGWVGRGSNVLAVQWVYSFPVETALRLRELIPRYPLDGKCEEKMRGENARRKCEGQDIQNTVP